MNKEEIGEYIRTRKGITKIEEVNKGCALNMACIDKDYEKVLRAINEKCKELGWLE